MPRIFTVSGLRGLAFKDLDYSSASFYAQVFAFFLHAKKLVVGHDTRKSHPQISEGVIDGFNMMGCNVINLGIVPTPTVVFMVRRLNADGGAVITASHNPPEWNGIKFISSRGEFINEQEFRRFSLFIHFFESHPDKIIEFMDYFGECNYYKNPFEEHIRTIIEHLRLKDLNLKVGVDADCGAGSKALPTLLEMAGCKVYKINCSFKANFPRPPEPVPENITKLCMLVKEKNLDLGLALDPDGDRLSIVDDKGIAIGEEKTLALAVDYILSKHKGPVVTNLSTTGLIDHIATRYKCPVYRTKVGEANVVSKMNEVKAVIGGEGNGGVIYPKINYTRDALTGAGIILKMLSKNNKKLSEIVNSYPAYFMLKDKVDISSTDFEKKRELILKKFRGDVDFSDGLRITTKTYWVHIRPSNTEPIVRIIAESKDRKKVKELIARAKEILGS
ncbi:MAG: phosphoglucosamine mutase [candidate division WOR-3 bacterium]|nr:phosphoglucosamine mutase [candidate division WOR-3 bacterium]